MSITGLDGLRARVRERVRERDGLERDLDERDRDRLLLERERLEERRLLEGVRLIVLRLVIAQMFSLVLPLYHNLTKGGNTLEKKNLTHIESRMRRLSTRALKDLPPHQRGYPTVLPLMMTPITPVSLSVPRRAVIMHHPSRPAPAISPAPSRSCTA
jgi:hypothetical protein